MEVKLLQPFVKKRAELVAEMDAIVLEEEKRKAEQILRWVCHLTFIVDTV